MTVHEIVQSVADQLRALYPERPIYVDELPANANNVYFVQCTKQSHVKGLDRRRHRSYSFEIVYVQTDKNQLNFYNWAEGMYSAFESLSIGDKMINLTNANATRGEDMAFRYVFTINQVEYVAPKANDLMGSLQASGGIKA
ncbi:DUF6838 family protein [Paenibacillus sp. GCM10027627]|uniref:phage tail terminator family protein n=1 Tax=unclassified Paenibacillus TaxID=185978 RepID=UPI00362BB648